MLKSVGESTPPCGTPFLNWHCVYFKRRFMEINKTIYIIAERGRNRNTVR